MAEVCEKHNVELKKAKGGKGGTYYYCGQCRHENAKVRTAQKKLRGIIYKGGKCTACGYDDLEHPEVFDFHHLDPLVKERDPCKAFRCSWETAKKEIDRCVLLCANCHRIAHSGGDDG